MGLIGKIAKTVKDKVVQSRKELAVAGAILGLSTALMLPAFAKVRQTSRDGRHSSYRLR